NRFFRFLKTSSMINLMAKPRVNPIKPDINPHTIGPQYNLKPILVPTTEKAVPSTSPTSNKDTPSAWSIVSNSFIFPGRVFSGIAKIFSFWIPFFSIAAIHISKEIWCLKVAISCIFITPSFGFLRFESSDVGNCLSKRISVLLQIIYYFRLHLYMHQKQQNHKLKVNIRTIQYVKPY